MVISMRIWSALLGLCLLMPASVWAATATASLDRSSTGIGESVQLRLHVDGSADHDPDISVLKHDFDILSQSQSSNYSLINGSLSRSQQWQLMLMPKHAGTLTIPPISFGNAVTQALSLRVSNQAQAAQGQHRQVFLDMHASITDVYVQAQMVLTVKLYRSVNLAQAQLSEPEAKHAIVKRLGKDKTYEVMQQGQRFVVTQRQYAVFPQQSGDMSIAGVVLNAQIDMGLGMFQQQGRVIRVASPDVLLKVHPMPASWDVHDAWLPATNVTLQEIPDAHPTDTWKVGEPMTRVFELRAHGLSAEQLPPIVTQPEMQGFKVYPDKPELRTEVDVDGVVGIRREKVAMIPTQAGDVRLPEIAVHWWNTQTGVAETSKVLGRSLHIVPSGQGGGGMQASRNMPPKTQVVVPDGADKTIEASKKDAPQDSDLSLMHKSEGMHLWQGVSAALLAGWLLTVLWLVSARRREQKGKDDAVMQRKVSLKSAQKQVRTACLHGTPQDAAQALVCWGRVVLQGDDVTHVGQLAGLSEDLDVALHDLQVALYATPEVRKEQPWDAQKLWQAVASWNDKKSQEQDGDVGGLKPLV